MIREAWCPYCAGPVEADESGCIPCRKTNVVNVVSRSEAQTKKRRYMDRQAAKSRRRRADLRSNKLCINGPSHGPATHGVKCGHCADVHKRGLACVLESPTFAQPSGYAPRPRRGGA